MKRWYTLVSRADVDGMLHFMNYGFHSDTTGIELDARSESERYPAQLYHHLASQADLSAKDVLEVGCGRGGGIHHVSRHFKPRSLHGVDLNRYAIDFCRSNYPEIRFDVMDAQDLGLADESFDVVINVESSHRYPDFPRFAREVHRVLRPGGVFLFADFRYSQDVSGVLDDLEAAGFRTDYSESINEQVLAALRLDAHRRLTLIKQYMPLVLRPAAREFAGTPGSRLYRSFREGKRRYLCLALSR